MRENDLSADGLSDYDVRIRRVLGAEMEISYKIQKSLGYPWIVNTLANIIHGNPNAISVLSRMYTDLELRAKIYKPSFWMGQALKRRVARA